MMKSPSLHILPLVGILAATLCGSVGTAAQPRPVAPGTASLRAATPEATAQSFYRWYVGLMAHDKEATDEPATYALYVSDGLRAQIARKMASADGMDVDYFVKTQDYLDQWLRQIAATAAEVRAGKARTVVTLGSGSSRQRLVVTLVQEKARWKIATVVRG